MSETNKYTIRILRKETFKDYCKVGLKGGGIFSFCLFLIGLQYGVLRALIGGLIVWLSFFCIIAGLGFFSEEYIKRKAQFKKLNSIKYNFLHDNGFKLNEELFFEGIFNNFYIKVFPVTKWITQRKKIDYVIIESYYEHSNFVGDLADKEELMSGEYMYGNFSFKDGRVVFISKNCVNPDFEKDFYGLFDICRRHDLIPHSA